MQNGTALHDKEKDVGPTGFDDAASLSSEERLREKIADNEGASPWSKDAVEEADGDDATRVHDGADGRDLESATATRVASGQPSARDINTIPDGGLRAWLQVLGSFFLFWNSWGIINAFGVYQTYYQETLLPNTPPSTIAWVGSIQAFLLLSVGAMTGPLYDAGHFRFLLATGTFFLVFGHMMLSLCKEYWQVLLAQAFCVGLGPGFLFVPSVAILSTYFRRKIASSIGLAAAGSSLGGVVYPIMLHKLIPQVGFGWAVRIIGFTVLATLLVPNFVMRVRVLPPAKRRAIDWKAFRDAPFMIFCAASLVGFMGLYMPFFYISSFAIDSGIARPDLAFYLLAILNSASTFGRVLPNFVADRTGPFNVFVPAALLSGVVTLTAVRVTSLAGVVCVCVAYGFCSGAYVSVPPTILVHLTDDKAMVGTRMGMCFGMTAVGMLVGAPIGGAILSSGGYDSIWVFGGVLLCAGGVITYFSRGLKYGWSPFIRA